MSSSQLIPRAYQEEIFNHAKHQNIIAALDTGSGKTYIAVLLIRWLAIRYTGQSHRIYVFLVPKVPLVDQQREFISEQVPLTVRGYYGALVDQWQHDPVRWRQEFKECDVMVMTAQVFLDAMLHAYWSMEQVALLVFDEAHHARKNHPYNQIMQDFFFTCDPRHRPKVLGMTASPVWNARNPQYSLQVLETNLNAKIVGVLEHNDELSQHSPRPMEIIQEYPPSPFKYPEYPQSLWEQLVALDLFPHPLIEQRNLEARYFVTLTEIGPYGADFFLTSSLVRLISDATRNHRYEYLTTQDRLRSIYDQTADSVQEEDQEKMSIDSVSEVSTSIFELEAALERFHGSISFEESTIIDSGWISPKLRVLVSVLAERRSSSFQGIIFVEQRQVASTLSWILPRIPELRGWIKSGALVGHGPRRDNAAATSNTGMVEKKQRELLKSFRDGDCNLLISTSVGEEGLDFQSCDLIVRYDQLQNMVGYLQSRGRARHRDSTYIVMIPEGSDEERMRYASMRESEPELRQLYQRRHITAHLHGDESGEPDDPADLAARDRYEISSTGAVLTFGSAVSLLNNLCALIPRDKYTAVLQPLYSGDFMSTVELPSALPIPREQLVYQGAIRRSKREAKAAVAFVACKALHLLKVFDDHLLPTRKTTGVLIEDADGRSIPEVNTFKEMMDVLVRDPWSDWYSPEDDNRTNPRAWVHAMLIGGEREARVGLVMADPLHCPVALCHEVRRIQLRTAVQVQWPLGNELQLLHDYTTLGIRWCNTSKLIQPMLTCFLVPLLSNGQPNFEVIREAVRNPISRNYGNITHTHEGSLLLQNKFNFGRPLLLRRLRDDLTPLSRPDSLDGSITDKEFETYADLYEFIHNNKKYPVTIPREGPMLLVENYTRNFSNQYSLHPSLAPKCEPERRQGKQTLLPAAICEICALPQHIFLAFRELPPLIRRVTDVYRAHAAIKQLGLPALDHDLVIEALTIPSAVAGFNNQRLETLGDSVLKLSVVVYLYNKYPFRHEGQLDGMRRNSVSNRTLLARAKEIGLESVLTSEPSTVRKWRPTTSDGLFVGGIWYAKRIFPRRSLQDCMEALLGVSFLTGGIDMALQTGTALRLCVGGIEPWATRYSSPALTPVPAFFDKLTQDMGYEFKSGYLLTEAVTHPSFQSDTSCYQRLEFLGDALLDVVVTEYLFKKFPSATSGQLSWARSRAVCAPTLATLAVKRLSLDKYLLANNVELGKALGRAVPVHRNISYEDVVLEAWKYDPPKVLSDIFESVCGAVLVDSGYDYQQTKGVVEKVMSPILETLKPDLPRDPVSELMLSLARRSCQQARFEKFSSKSEKSTQSDCVQFRLHDKIVGSPLHAAVGGLYRAKVLLAQRVQEMLKDSTSEFSLDRLCNCKEARQEKKKPSLDDIDREKLNDEKEEEFAALGMLQLKEVDGVLEVIAEDRHEDEVDGHDEVDL